jgi:uncharacterized protein YdeI (YjbR/CyaY-like superfamily)
MPKDNLPILLFRDESTFEAWLDAHHASADGLWLKIAKKDSGIASVNYTQALDIALCYGWIDGQKAAFDAQHFLQRFTPRRKKSMWSAINRDKVTVLITQGRMREAGQREIDAAKADGRWDNAYHSQANATVPDDLQAALDADPAAKSFFATLNGANRYAVLYRVQTAKTPENRAKKIAQLVAMLAEGKTIHPQ